jgi:hypothetical protein
VQHARNSCYACLSNQTTRVVFGVASMHHHGFRHLLGKLELGGEGIALEVARRIVVVVVQPAFTHCYGASPEKLAQPRDVASRIERSGVVRVDSCRGEHEPGVIRGNSRGNRGRIERLSDADNPRRARLAGAGDYRVAVAGERRVCEVGVAVDED